MYWWLGMWMSIVAGVLGTVAFSIFAQTMGWDSRTFLEWLKGAPDGWGPRMHRGLQAGRKWAGDMAALVFSGVSLISSGKWKELAVRARSSKGSGKKVDASFYRDLYRAMPKSEPVEEKEPFGYSLWKKAG